MQNKLRHAPGSDTIFALLARHPFTHARTPRASTHKRLFEASGKETIRLQRAGRDARTTQTGRNVGSGHPSPFDGLTACLYWLPLGPETEGKLFTGWLQIPGWAAMDTH
ncbi:hypothetical protein O1611_g5243 [Lasiodiplodia mahajangana]|uniref:Uncharacterized protein n=1 Tax=Lasiodiplodia mahajangana TaxID=1108764 RepID=A0ACC2JLL1_9PEZI|nr:hypothetical protein O1611_g5243 [Lasiodiplodia mahajangana]